MRVGSTRRTSHHQRQQATMPLDLLYEKVVVRGGGTQKKDVDSCICSSRTSVHQAGGKSSVHSGVSVGELISQPGISSIAVSIAAAGDTATSRSVRGCLPCW